MNNKIAITAQAAKGVFWNNLANYISAGVNFIGGIYLARKISPAYFGEATLAYSILCIVGAIVMLGEDYAIIKQRKNIKRLIGTQLTLRIIITCFIAIILFIVWQLNLLPISQEIQYYLFLLYITLAIMQITSIYWHYMHKMLMFKRLALIDMTSVFGSFGLACILAYYDYKLWALLWLWMSRHLILAFLTIIFVPYRFLPCFDKKVAVQFLNFGKFIFSANLMKRLNDKISDILVGTLIGNVALGFYQRAYGLCGLLQQVVISGVTSVSAPVVGMIKESKERLGKSLQFMGGLVLRLAIGGYVLLALILPQFISRVYGENWLPAVPVFRWMLPFALLQSFMIMLVDFHFIVGKSSVVARITAIELGILLILLYPMIFLKGVVGAVIAVDISTIVGTVLFLYYLKPLANFSIRDLFLNPLIAVLISSGAFFLANRLTYLLISIFTFCIIFAISLLILEFRFWKETYMRVQKSIQKQSL